MRHGLRRLLRVARRLDGDRAMLRALLPVAGAHLPSLPGGEEEERDDTVRGVVMRAVREAGGVAAARPEGVRAMSRHAAALEAVIARARNDPRRGPRRKVPTVRITHRHGVMTNIL